MQKVFTIPHKKSLAGKYGAPYIRGMPSQLAHIQLGLEAASALPRGWLERFPTPAFYLGCQGPDVFYHNRRTKPGAFLYGTRLHRRGWGAFLSRFRREALTRGWGPEHPGMAFLAGQATHGFLDRRVHPFVVSFAGWKVPGDVTTAPLRHSHAFLERIHDVLLWNQRVGTPFGRCRWQEEFPSVADFPHEFWTVWAEALHEVFPRLSERADVEPRLRNAVLDTKGFLAYTAPSSTGYALNAARAGAIHYFHPVALPDWDFLNHSHAEWPDPLTGRLRTESFWDLFELALEDSRRALALLTDPAADWEALIGNGSLNLPDEEGQSAGPSFSRPWDYETLYDREVEARLAGVIPPGLL